MAVYKRDIIDINLETGNIYRSWLKHSIGMKDQKADHFGVRVFRNGEAVSLTGVSVQGVFMPPQGDPIAITSGNIVSGNVAEVVLPQACYNYDGQFTLAIKLVDSTNSVTGTVRIVDGMVDNTHATGTVAPTSAVPTYQEVLSVYEQAITVIGKSVRFDTDQSLTDAQKTTARTNIAAASTGELSDVKSALNNSIKLPGSEKVGLSDFTDASNVTYEVDSETESITITNTGTQGYNNVQTANTWGATNLKPGRTYRLHAKAEKISGTPIMRICIRGTSANADGVSKGINFGSVGGEGFIDFVADEYMKRVTLFVSFGSSTKNSVSKFSDIWLKEYNPTGIDYECRSEMDDLKSAVTDIEDKVGDIEEISVAFTNGKAIYYSNGNASNSSVLSYSGYKKIPEGYTKLRLSMVIRADDVNTGMAFYTSNAESAYISGKKNKIDSTITGYGSEIIDIPIPSTAKYFRTSWIATTNPSYDSNTFYCAFIKTGTMEEQIAELYGTKTVADTNRLLIEDIHGIVEYNGADCDISAVGSTTETAIGVKREGFLVTLNGMNTSRDVFIKINGNVQRTIYDSGKEAWSSTLLLPAGAWKVVLKAISGTVSYTGDRPCSIGVYKQGGHNTIATIKTENGNVVANFTSDGSTAYNIALIPKEDAEFTDAKYLVYLESVKTNDSYYDDEVKSVRAKVQDALTEPAVTFALITDCHRYVSSFSSQQNFAQTMNNIKGMASLFDIDCLINLGDMLEGDTARATTLKYASNCMEDILAVGLPYFFISGNHDPNPYYNNKAQMFTPKEMFKAYYSATNKAYFDMSENGTEYYVDYDEIGVRFVFLNSSVASNASIYSFGTNARAWLENHAFNTEHTVILCVHVSPYSSMVAGTQVVDNSSGVRTAIQSFVNNGGNLIMLGGHSHVDMAFYSPCVSVMQVCQRMCSNEEDVIMGAGTSYEDITGYIDNIVRPGRVYGTASEDAWSLCVYKPISNDLDMIRFGAGTDWHFHVTPIEPTTVESKMTGEVAWGTTDSSVATVSDGVITGVSSGRCAIFAKDEEGNREVWIVEN